MDLDPAGRRTPRRSRSGTASPHRANLIRSRRPIQTGRDRRRPRGAQDHAGGRAARLSPCIAVRVWARAPSWLRRGTRERRTARAREWTSGEGPVGQHGMCVAFLVAVRMDRRRFASRRRGRWPAAGPAAHVTAHMDGFSAPMTVVNIHLGLVAERSCDTCPARCPRHVHHHLIARAGY